MKTSIQIAHILRKYNPKEWAGTETSLKEMLEAWKPDGIQSTLYCPAISPGIIGSFEEMNVPIERFKAFLPILGLSNENKERLVSIGGNLMSFDLSKHLERNKKLSLIHSHTMGLVGALGEKTARRMGIPFVLSIHGGALDLPKESLERLTAPQRGGLPWGKIFSLFLRPDRLLEKADAIITFNPREEALLRKKKPGKRIVHIPHGIDVQKYQKDHRREAINAFPFLKEVSFGLISARIDPVKNQLWVIELLPRIRKYWPGFCLVLAGPITDQAYEQVVRKRIQELKLEDSVHLVGGFPYDDPRLIGLLQLAKALILPSIAEPFGRVVLEAWSAGTPVLASRTSGVEGMVSHGETGWLFGVNDEEGFFEGIESLLKMERNVTDQAKILASSQYDIRISSRKVLDLYKELLL